MFEPKQSHTQSPLVISSRIPRQVNHFLISTIVSTYKSEKFIRGCLEDLIEQTIYRQGQMEIIVIDSHSPEGEGDIVREYLQHYPDITYIRTTQRETVYAAWNRGVQAAQGKYLSNANTDDRHHPDALRRMVQALEENQAYALCYADVAVTQAENLCFAQAPIAACFKWPDFDARLLFRTCFMGPQPVWRKQLHDHYGLFDPYFIPAGDYEFWLRMAPQEKFLHLPEVLGVYLLSPTSVEHRNQKVSAIESELARMRYWPSEWGNREPQPGISFLKPPETTAQRPSPSISSPSGTTADASANNAAPLVCRAKVPPSPKSNNSFVPSPGMAFSTNLVSPRTIQNIAPIPAPAKAGPHLVIDGVIFQLQAGRPLGISYVWRNLLPELVKSNPGLNITFLRRQGTSIPFAAGNQIEIPAYRFGAESVLQEDDQRLSRICREIQGSTFISTYYTRAAGLRNVMMVHDLIPEIFGFDLTQPEWVAKRRCINQAEGFVAVSDSTRRDLMKVYGAPSDKIIVAPLGAPSIENSVDSKARDAFVRNFRIQHPFFLLVGNRGLYKNSLPFLKAFGSLEERNYLQIIAVGGGATPLPQEAEFTKGINFVCIPFLPQEEMPGLYASALALVYPSRYEGFGIPVLEAMTYGCPVITSARASLPEVGGDTVIYIDPDSIAEITAALRRVMMPEVRQDLGERSRRRAKQFTWTKMVARMMPMLMQNYSSATNGKYHNGSSISDSYVAAVG